MKIIWTCTHYIGDYKWHGTEYYEQDECGATFETEVEEEEWSSRSTSASCPQCGNTLSQRYDSAIRIAR